MPISQNARSAAAIHRKIRALAAVVSDPVATKNEKANAQSLKEGLEKQINGQGTSQRPWTNIMFQLGRGVKEVQEIASPSPQRATGRFAPSGLAK